MALSRVLEYDFSGDDVDVVNVSIDGTNAFLGTSSGPGVLKMPYPALNSYELLTGADDAEYVAVSLTDSTTLYTFDRAISELGEIVKATGAITTLATPALGGYAIQQRPATGDLWITNFTRDVQVFDDSGTHLADYDAFPNRPGSGEWLDDRLYITDAFFDGFGYLEPDGTFTMVLSDAVNLPQPEDLTIHGDRIYIAERDFGGDSGLWSCNLDGTDLVLEDDGPQLAGLTIYGDTIYACDPSAQHLYSYRLGGGGWYLGVAGWSS